MFKCLITVLCLLPFCIASDMYQKSYPFKPGQKLEIDLPGGSIEVVGKDVQEISVSFEYNDSNRDFELKAEGHAQGLRLEGKQKRGHNLKLKLEVTVPRELQLEMETKGGNLSCEGLLGKVNGETKGGNIKVKDLDVEINLKTMGGNISVESSKLNGSVETMGGNIAIVRSQGLVDCKTMGGNISLDNEGTRVEDPRALKISTMGGNIKIASAPGGIHAETNGGKIEIGSVSGQAILETKGGNIRVEALDGKIDAKTMGGAIQVTMVGDGQEGNCQVNLESKGGDISLTLPAKFSAKFDLEIERRFREKKIPEIHSDFTVSVSGDDKQVTAKGAVQGGKNPVTIRTINGDIHIRKGN